MTKHPWLRRLVIALAVCVVVVVAFVAFLLLFQPTLNLSPFKRLLEEQLTELAGAPVTLQELHVKTSLQPGVEVRDLWLAEAASVETTQLQIELVPLLQRHISIESLKLDQVTVQLRPTLELVKSRIGHEDRPKSPYRVDALQNLEFDRVQLNVTDEQGDNHRLTLDELDGGITRSSPLKLEARGNFDEIPLKFKAGGPTLDELFAPASTLPFTAALEIAGAALSLEGTFDKQASQPTLALAFGLGGDDLTTTLAAAGMEVPSLGPFQLQGSLTHSGGPIQLSALEGQIDQTDFSSNLNLSFENERLALAGELQTGQIDLQPWLQPGQGTDDPDTEDTGPGERLLDRLLPVEAIEKALAAMDLDLEVAIDGLDGLATTVAQLTASPKLQDGRLTLPYGLQVAGAPVQGQVEVTSTLGRLELALDLTSSTLPLDQLSEDLGKDLTTGTIGQVHLSASSSGATVGDLVNELAFDLETGDSQIQFRSPDNDRQVDLVLTRMELSRNAEMPIRATLNGDLRGYPYRIELEGKETKDWGSSDSWPFTLTSEGLGGTTRIEGHVSIEPEDWFLDLELDISGDRIGDLEPWWGGRADADYSYEAHGHLIVDPEQRELRLDTLRVGHSTATLTLQIPPKGESPLVVDLDASTVVLDEIESLIEGEDEELASEPVLTLDIPIWPEELSFPDTRAHLELDQVLRDSPGRADFDNVVVDVDIFQSHLKRVAFTARAEEASLRGQLDLNWAEDPPEMHLDLGGEALDLGRLVELDQAAPDLTVRARQFDVQVTGAARTLRQMFLEGVTISGKAEGVFISAPSLDEEAPLELTLDQAEISEAPNTPILVKANGLLWEWPVDLQLTLHNKNRAGPDADHLPVEMILRAGDVRLETTGELMMPVSPDNLDLTFSVTADRVSSFEPFTGHRLSEVGPVAATGNLAIRPDNYSLEDLSLEVGESDINGEVSLDLADRRSRLAADLSSQRIHLAELFAHTSTPEDVPGDTTEEEAPKDASDEAEEKSWQEKLQSSKLASMDIDLNLQADDIYWGGDTGGGGQIRAQLEEGRLSVGPFRLALADGIVEGRVLLLSKTGLVDADLDLTVDNLESGPILRFFNPDAEGHGTIDLKAQLQTSSVPVEQVISGATGSLRFAVFPQGVDTTLLNFWGAGLLRSMVGVVDPTDESVLNCMAGDFSVSDGVMTANSFWFDTSRIRARGKGSIDLQDMTLDMTLRPRPKKRTFLSLATPAKIKGPLEDPSITLAKGGLVGTAFRLYMWTLTFYAQVFKKPLPTDGSDVCFLPPPPETEEVKRCQPNLDVGNLDRYRATIHPLSDSVVIDSKRQ